MRRRLLLAAALATLFSVTSASAQERLADQSCTTSLVGSCSGIGGLFVFAGGSFWAKQSGLSIGFGLFHQYRFGFETHLSIPLMGTTGQTIPSANLVARLALLREGLTGVWSAERGPPSVGLIVSLRAGVGFLHEPDSKPPVTFLIGPSAELLVGRTFLVGLRPSVALRLASTSEGGGPISIEAFPMMDVSVGWVSEYAYSH